FCLGAYLSLCACFSQLPLSQHNFFWDVLVSFTLDNLGDDLGEQAFLLYMAKTGKVSFILDHYMYTMDEFYL
ncbi:hypothetical protein ACJX0J_027441, partial [Zea mays]